MTATKSPFRTSFAACELCGSEVESSELTPVAHLSTCPKCRGGDLNDALRAHSFTEEHRQYVYSSSDCHENVVRIELDRPSELDLTVTFASDKGSDTWLGRLFRKPDPEVGFEEFDRRIRIVLYEKYEPTAKAFLQSAGAREAILRLVAMRCRVVLGDPQFIDEGRETPDGKRVTAEAREYLRSNAPELGEMMPYVIALAVHLERFARESTA